MAGPRKTRAPKLPPLTALSAASGQGMEWLPSLPKTPPIDGRVLVHNEVYPVTRRQGWLGSRYWLEAADAVRLEACACGWAAELGTHYRVRLAHTKGSAARGTCRSSCMGR